MLEHARAGERAVLGHVADEQDGDPGALGDLHHPPGRLAHLADRAGRARQIGGVERLDGVDHADLGPLGASVARTVSRSVSASTGTSSAPAAPQPLGSQADLRRPTPRPET